MFVVNPGYCNTKKGEANFLKQAVSQGKALIESRNKQCFYLGYDQSLSRSNNVRKIYPCNNPRCFEFPFS